jgi:hypothetical protein
MKWEYILLGVCIVATLFLAYYFWTKNKEQQQAIHDLNKRMEAIELMFIPLPREDINHIFSDSEQRVGRRQGPPMAAPFTPTAFGGGLEASAVSASHLPSKVMTSNNQHLESFGSVSSFQNDRSRESQFQVHEYPSVRRAEGPTCTLPPSAAPTSASRLMAGPSALPPSGPSPEVAGPSTSQHACSFVTKSHIGQPTQMSSDAVENETYEETELTKESFDSNNLSCCELIPTIIPTSGDELDEIADNMLNTLIPRKDLNNNL